MFSHSMPKRCLFVVLAAALVTPVFAQEKLDVSGERTERIRLLVGSDLGCAAWQAGAAAVAAGGGPVVIVLVLAALTSATSTVYSPAVAATIPSAAVSGC